MAEKFPLKAIFDGGGAATDLAEFAVGDFVGLSSGGLGFTTVAGGDLMVGAVGGGSISKLPIGAPSTVLMVSGGAPAWSLITNANISSSAAIDWTKMNGTLPSTMVPVPLTLSRAAANAADAHLILVETGAGAGAPMNWRRNAAVRANVYLAANDELVFRYATGAAGSETYTEAMRISNIVGGPAGVTGAIISPNIYGRTQVSTDGYMAMHGGGASNAGFMEWYRPGPTRIGYLGYTAATSWLNMTLENAVGFQVTATDPAAPAGIKIGFDPTSNTKAHLDITRNTSSVAEWIAFRTGAFAYDMYVGRWPDSDALSISRWNGAGDPVEIAAFTPSNGTLTVMGQVNSGRGVRTEGSVFFGTGLGIELSATPGAGYVETYNRSSSTWGSQVYGASLHTFNINNVAVLTVDAGRVGAIGGINANGIIRGTGTAGTISGGPGAELYWNGGQSVVQSFDRTAGTYQPLILSGSNLQFYMGGIPKWTIDASGYLTTPAVFNMYAGAVTSALNRYFHDSSNVALRHGASPGSGIYFQDSAANNILYASADNGFTFATNTGGYAYDFRQNSTTGYGMRVWSLNDNLPAFSVLNAAGSAWAMQVQGNGNVIIGAGITAPVIQGRQAALPLHGYTSINRGDASNVGYIEWYKPGPTRIAYMGYGAGTYLNLNLEGSSFFINGPVEMNNGNVLSFRDSGGTGKHGLSITPGNVMQLGEPAIPLRIQSLSMSFYNKIGTVALQTITGSRGGNAALASLLTALNNLNLINDTTT